MIKLNGRDCYFVIPESKYGLSTIIPKYVTDDDFTFMVKCKPQWSMMKEGNWSQEGGLVIKNGMHMGISCFVNGGDRYFKGTLWLENRKGEKNCIEHHFLVSGEDKDKEYFISFRHSIKEKKLVIGNYDHYKVTRYSAERPIDYSDSWLWIGAANAFKSCDEEHKHYFRGEISFVGVWGEYLSDSDIQNISENCGNIKNMKKIQNDKTVLFSNFKTRTPYKVYDDSDNGNHVILYDEAWLQD